MMAGPNLSTHRTTADTADTHVSDHNTIHQMLNVFDKDATATAGQVLQFDSASGLYKPTSFSMPGFSVYNSGTSAYAPVRDPGATHWVYIQPVAGGPVPNDTNGGAGRQDMDELIVKPS